MAQAPEVAVIARPAPLDLAAPRTNPALDLARSLSDLNDELTPVLVGIARRDGEKQRAKAFQDALSQSGKAFAEAVREGKIRPTQNPWYVQAYEEKAAQVRAQGQVSQLVSESQTWEEKSDPQAFAARWAKEVGHIGQGYTTADQQKGFQAAAAPLSQQVLNSNVEFNAQAMVANNVQNTTQLMSTALEELYKKNPKATSAEMFAAIAPYEAQWKATGGTQAQFNDLTKGAFSAAASSVGDADVLEHLKFDRGGKGALYNIVDPNGNAWSAEIEQTKYRITRTQELAGMGEVHRQQAAQELAGYKVQSWAYQKWGWDLPAGKVPMSTIMEEAKAAGFTPQGVQAYLHLESKDLSANNTYMRAQTQQYALDPGNQDTILKLRSRALKEGWSADLENQVWEQVRNGMDEGTANDILTKADSTAKYFRSEARSDSREARAQDNFSRQLHQQGSRDVKQSIAESIGMTSGTLSGVGDNALTRNPAERSAVTRGATDAANAHLRAHPDDYVGASKAADDYLDRYAKLRLARLRGKSSGGTNKGGLSQGANPLRH